jgi:hypothetical protein
LTERALLWVNRLLLIALGVFIISIIGITTISFNPPDWIALPAAWVSGTSMIFILAGPPAVELVLIFSGGKKRK